MPETILPLSAKLEGQRIVAERPDEELVDLVLEQKRIVILKGVFDPNALKDLRNTLWEWAKDQEPIPENRGNGYRTTHVEKTGEQATLYNRTWWFLDLPHLEENLRTALLSFFEPMRDIQNRLGGNAHTYERDASGMRLRPQVIQYPQGMGYFGDHTHPFAPQRVGLIASMSQYGVDYGSGSTYFMIDNKKVTTEGHHFIGDLTIFRYDLVHGVTAVDPDQEADWQSKRGRWVMVLPFKKN